MCIIKGVDIVGPKVRTAIYAQSLLLLFKVFSNKRLTIISVIFEFLTATLLTISAIHEYRTHNLHYVFLIEVSFLTFLLSSIATYLFLCLIFMKRNKSSWPYVLALLISVAYLFVVCFGIWLWTTIKWRLPEQKCGDQIRLYFFTIPLNPIGWIRYLSLAFYCIQLISYLIIIVKLVCLLTNLDDAYNSENGDNVNLRVGCCLAILMLSSLIGGIMSNEMFLKRNPISGISEGWNIKNVFITTMTGGNTISTILFLLRKLYRTEICKV
jgi:hypothetical protein